MCRIYVSISLYLSGVVSGAAVTILVHISFEDLFSILVHACLGVDLLNHMVTMFN